eukprot:8230061-Alexandrium_andersonii.AAC.1
MFEALGTEGGMIDLDLPEHAPKEATAHEVREAGVVKRLAGGATVVEEDARALDAFAAVFEAPKTAITDNRVEGLDRRAMPSPLRELL